MTKKTYVHVIEGNKVTEEYYNSLSDINKGYYDSIASVSKAKQSIRLEEVMEDEEE